MTILKPRPLPNLKTVTLGGQQFWQDRDIHAGWRIQENILTGHCRLLDPENKRIAWGHYKTCTSGLEKIRHNPRIHQLSRHAVLLIHGIGPSPRPFKKMQSALAEAGFEAIPVHYPSTFNTIECHARSLTGLLNRIEGIDQVSFVTHSMGGLVLCEALSCEPYWRENIRINRTVMIAPPNQGSVMAGLLKNVPLYQFLYGEPGQQLTPRAARKRPEFPDIPLMIIAGGKQNRHGFNPFLQGDNDGMVKVSETRLGDIKPSVIIPALHATLCKHPETIRHTLNFLKLGKSPPRTNSYTLSQTADETR